MQDRRGDKNSINGILPRKALPKKNWNASQSVNGGRTPLLRTLQAVAAAAAAISSKSLYPVCPTSLPLSTASRPARRRQAEGHPVFQDWVRPMSMLAPRHRGYPPLRPWDLPVLVPKDKHKAVSSHEEGRRFLVRTICFGIITARVVGLQIGIGTGEETEGEWIEIEIHEGEDRIQEVIRCMAVGQGDLLPVLHQVKGDTITPLLLPTIPLTRRHPTLLRPTTNPAIRPHPITLCPLDPVLLLKVILIIDLLRDPLRIIIQVAKEITALPLPAGMASTAVVVVVEEEEGTVGMDGDRTKRHREREREMHHGYCTTNYLMCKTCTQLICQPRAQRATVKPN